MTALTVFQETVAYYGRLQQEGKIESYEPMLLEPHGGGLAGFIVLRGDRASLDEIRSINSQLVISNRSVNSIGRQTRARQFASLATGIANCRNRSGASGLGSVSTITSSPTETAGKYPYTTAALARMPSVDNRSNQ